MIDHLTLKINQAKTVNIWQQHFVKKLKLGKQNCRKYEWSMWF